MQVGSRSDLGTAYPSTLIPPATVGTNHDSAIVSPPPCRFAAVERAAFTPVPVDDTALPACKSSQQYTCEVGLRAGEGYKYDRFVLMGFIGFVDICSHYPSTEGSDLTVQWWARYQNTSIEHAQASLAEISLQLEHLFYEAEPGVRPQLWRSLRQALRRDINTVLAISQAVSLKPEPVTDTACEPARTRHFITYRDIAVALDHAQATGSAFVRSDAGYLLGLSMALRTHHSAIVAWLETRVDIDPHAVLDFVDAHFGRRYGDVPMAYFDRRRTDLACLLFFMGRHRSSCALEPLATPQLAELRQIYDDALVQFPIEQAIVARLFEPSVLPSEAPPGSSTESSADAYPDSSDDIIHDGFAMRNAQGMTADQLVAAVALKDAGFARLPVDRQNAVVRIKLVQLEECPDYPIGHVLHSMATTLMRMSDAASDLRYQRYDSPLSLLQAWETRHKKWLIFRDFPFSPELYGSIHTARANGIVLSPLSWYRDLWEEKIISVITQHPVVCQASAADRAALWRWLEGHLHEWDASVQRWRNVDTEAYTQAVLRIVDVFYRLKQPQHQPRATPYILTYSVGASLETSWTFSPLLDGLSIPIKSALSEIAAAFDTAALYQERLLFDNWLGASFRILDYTHHRAMAQFQPPPSFSVEVEAYLALQDLGLNHEGVFAMRAYIVNSMAPPDERPTIGYAYEKFLSVIRSPRRDDLLILLDGQRLYPHHIINRAYDQYIQDLSKNQWIVGHARQNLRDRGIPLLPSLIDTEIERLAQPFRDKASKSTVLGTQMADDWFGSFPISSPLLKLTRSIRDGKYAELPYYLLVLGRDVLATAALIKGVAAAYLAPVLVTAGRLGGVALLTSNSMPRTPKGRSMRGWTPESGRSAKPEKPREINLLSDHTPDLKTQVIRSRTRSNAAQQLSNLVEGRDSEGRNGLTNDRFYRDRWEIMRKQLLPNGTVEAAQQQRLLYQLNEDLELALFDLKSGHDSPTPSGVGLLGLSQIDITTEHAGLRLMERPTVAEVYQCTLSVLDSADRNATQMVERHVDVIYDALPDTVGSEALPRADTVIELIVRAYRLSAVFRRVLNAYDMNAIEAEGLQIIFDTEARYPQRVRSSGAYRVVLRVPDRGEHMPTILTEGGFTKLTLERAVIESVVGFLISAGEVADASLGRGAAVWVANMVQLEMGQAFLPRLNAEYYGAGAAVGGASELRDPRDIALLQAEVARQCEWEDQLLERVSAFRAPSVSHGRFQSQPVDSRPTVVGVIALLTRLNYLALLQAQAHDVAFTATPGQGWALLTERVDVSAVTDPQRLAEFRDRIDTCYAQSFLFRCILSDPSPRVPSAPQFSDTSLTLQYQGLARIVSHADTNVHAPTGPLHSLDPIDHLLELTLDALIGDPTQTADRHSLSHRGTAVWVADLVLRQAGFLTNKRLAKQLLIPGDARSKALLNAYAASNRRWARVEDHFIWQWLIDQIPGE